MVNPSGSDDTDEDASNPKSPESLQSRDLSSVTISSAIAGATEEKKKPYYASVWQCPLIKRHGKKGSEEEAWECLVCNGTFKKFNHAKAVVHLVGNLPGHAKLSIRDCDKRDEIRADIFEALMQLRPDNH